MPGPCRVMMPGGAYRAAGAGPAGEGTGWAVSVTAPIPAVRGQAFSCPWLCGAGGARTGSGRRWTWTASENTYPLVSGICLGLKESGLTKR
jgi:hypothetical protein